MFWATTAEVRFPFPFVPENIGMQGAVFVDAGSLWDPSQLAVNAVNQEGQLHLRQLAGAPVDRVQPHLAVALGPAPRRLRPGPA